MLKTHFEFLIDPEDELENIRFFNQESFPTNEPFQKAMDALFISLRASFKIM